MHPASTPRSSSRRRPAPPSASGSDGSGRRVILTVGALQKRKGQDMMIRALPAILGPVPDVLYVIAGEGWERPYLEQLVAEHGVQRRRAVPRRRPTTGTDRVLPAVRPVRAAQPAGRLGLRGVRHRAAGGAGVRQAGPGREVRGDRRDDEGTRHRGGDRLHLTGPAGRDGPRPELDRFRRLHPRNAADESSR